MTLKTTRISFIAAVFVLTAQLWAATSLAALSCHGVLLRESAISDSSISATIESLAELRVKLDLQKSFGAANPASKKLEKDYGQKLQEFSQKLQMDAFQARKMIRARVLTLQSRLTKDENKSREEEQKRRGQEIQTQSLNYSLVHEGLIAEFGWTVEWMAELSPGKLLVSALGDIVVADLAKQTTSVLAKYTSASSMSSDQKSLYVLNREGLLSIYSLPKLSEPREVALPLGALGVNPSQIHPLIAVNKSGTKIALAYFPQSILIFDTASGKLDYDLRSEHLSFNNGVSMSFRNDSELIVGSESTLVKFDVDSKKISGVQVLKNRLIGKALIDSQSQEFMVISKQDDGSKGKVWTLDLDSFEVKTETELTALDISNVPGSENSIAIRFMERAGVGENALGLYNRDNLRTPLFDFLRYYEPARPVAGIYFSADGNRAYVIGRRGFTYTEGAIDFWARPPMQAP